MADVIEATVVVPASRVDDQDLFSDLTDSSVEMEPSIESQQARTDFRQISILYMLLVIAAGGGLTWFFVGGALTPLKVLNSRMKSCTANNLSQQLPVPQTHDEVAELTVSFNQMSSKLDQAFAMQRRFAQSAAHELRTPLTVLRTKVDVFKKRADHSQQEYDKLIDGVIAQTNRLSGLVQELLELTNLDGVTERERIPLHELLEQIAVQDLISLGKLLLLPNDDLSLAEVLKSPLFGLTDDDLFVLCYQRDGSLFNSILRHPNYASLADQLKELLNLAGFARPFELFNTVLVKFRGRKNFISRMGIEVEDVLDEFLNLALIFEQTNTPTLEAFIAWIIQDEVIIQKEMEQGESNTVKIMTVHGSKGLQAPIVILADTTKIKNKSRKSEFLWSDDGLVYFPTSADGYDANCAKIKAANPTPEKSGSRF